MNNVDTEATGTADQVVLGTIWNLTGMIVPLVLAVICIPLLIDGLGTARFGMLTIAWVVMGYFSFFDFGLGRATTKYVSEHLEHGSGRTLQSVIWSSIFAHIFLGVIGGLILLALAEPLASKFLNSPFDLQTEVRNTFYLLAFSVPLVVVSAAFRGLLEAINRFDLVNIVKIPSSVVNYVGPFLIVWLLSNDLVPVVGIIAVGRAAVLVFYIFFCFRFFPPIRRRSKFDFGTVKSMLGFGGWLTISNMTNTVLASLDRFMIGAFISVAAVAYYATPYEIVTKLWLFSASLLAVLFPRFTAMGVNRRHEIPAIFSRAVILLLVLTTPFVALFLALGYEMMTLWIDEEFAVESTPVLTCLSIGVLINVLAQVPSTFMQSLGRADIPAKLHLCELPLYAVAIWLVVPEAGILGVATVWTGRAIVDAGALFSISKGMLLPKRENGAKAHYLEQVLITIIFLALFFALSYLPNRMILYQVLSTGILLFILLLWEWQFLLNRTERKWLCQRIKGLLAKTTRPNNA